MDEIQVVKYVNGLLTENCFLVINKNINHGFIIDPGMKIDDLISDIKNSNIIIDAIFLTHGHFDHSMKANELSNLYNCDIYANENEKEILESEQYNLSKKFFKPTIITNVKYLKDNEEITISNINIKCILTPGHTKGGMCYMLNKYDIIFTGDTLFKNSFGRYDLYSGSLEEIKNSIINKLFVLNPNMIVYPGHGENTTILQEQKDNMIFKF